LTKEDGGIKEAVIVDAVRTTIGKFKRCSLRRFGPHVIEELVISNLVGSFFVENVIFR
jgi:acetyl-CoA acetyltransferase